MVYIFLIRSCFINVNLPYPVNARGKPKITAKVGEFRSVECLVLSVGLKKSENLLGNFHLKLNT